MSTNAMIFADWVVLLYKEKVDPMARSPIHTHVQVCAHTHMTRNVDPTFPRILKNPSNIFNQGVALGRTEMGLIILDFAEHCIWYGHILDTVCKTSFLVMLSLRSKVLLL
ncbi:hypothetical protein M758_6G168000 [Ceratodon purpureus]|uniref:Uncharacterized protein n=1 Tax=Ceratodon purpureus TaxID=3225 RepID=A0A8T0HG48_CERPU|nr:hypothetical protein KC19_6G174400 [Ceratodon purpureus]KAG0614320.1 hypothetical protein M758_6G168000 [Ceratodon purpureus]